MLSRVVLGCSFAVGWLLALPSFAQEIGTPAAVDPRAAAISPFLDADAFMVVHLDLRQVDIRGAVDRITALAPPDAKEQVGQIRTMSAVGVQLRTQLVESGVVEVYAVATMGTGGEKPDAFIVVPVEKGKDIAAAKMAIEMIPGVKEEQLFVHNGHIIGGPPAIKDFVTKITPGKHPSLADAFRFSGTTAFQLIVMPNKKLAGAAKNLPGGIPGDLPKPEEVAEDMKAIVITANLPPKPALAIFGHAKDETAAKDAIAEVNKLLESEQAKEVLALPALAKLAPFLKPTQDGPRLRVVLTETNGGIEALSNAIKSGLEMLGPLALPAQP